MCMGEEGGGAAVISKGQVRCEVERGKDAGEWRVGRMTDSALHGPGDEGSMHARVRDAKLTLDHAETPCKFHGRSRI